MYGLIESQIKKEIDRAQRVLLLTDDNRIDGDTIGSTLGMYHVLMDLGKDVDIFSPKPMNDVLSFLPGVKAIRRDEDIFQETFDLIMTFDCPVGEYYQEKLSMMPDGIRTIAFDHHASNHQFGDLNLIEPEAASTADVLWRFLKLTEYDISKDAAQCILTGICTDTDTFTTSNTTAACLEAAHELSQFGARLQDIVRHTMMNKSVPALKLWGLAFERLHENKAFGALTTVITQKDLHKLQVDEKDLMGLSNFLNAMVEGVDAILVLRETEGGHVKGSLRSRTKNVLKIAQKYGGGGHERACGFLIKDAYLDEKGGEWKVVKHS